MSSKKKAKLKKEDSNSLTCKPLDSYSEILLFLENPPPWRTLCKEITPHSKKLIRNVDIHRNSLRPHDAPEYFCHFDPDMEEVERYDEKTLCKTLVCHDMANGYHDDSVIDGTDNYEGYTFYNWAGIDIFCYFSHHLITIPPVSWINVAHAHGVKVIGTVITEWADGITFWEQILASETEYLNLASALVAIAKTMKFEGWLLNIENKISKPDVLLDFVRIFHRLLHDELENAVLLWYDSVTIQGNLNWQNGLNEKNKDFFNACDGFFTNYSWTVNDVASSAAEAEDRVADLYIGIDVWGRNFYGGGEFNTREAIKVAYHSGCSLAIFAPAWTHEALSTEKNDHNTVALAEDLDKYGQFLLRDRALWDSIWPFLNTRVPCHMPFQTSFCKGQGQKRRLYGEALAASPWYNLRHQQYQPNAAHGPHGYVLSTADKIMKVAHSGHFKDKKGIIRYRSSLQLSRNELRADSVKEQQHSTESFTEDDTTDSGIVKSDESRRKKVKKAFQNLFKQKKSDEEESKSSKHDLKLDVPEEHANKDKDEPKSREPSDLRISESVAGPSSSMTTSSAGRAMMATTVNLRLGNTAEKTRYCLARVAVEQECLEQYFEDCFNGGACLKVNPSDQLTPEHRLTRLFFCDFTCVDTLIFCVVTKTLKQYSNQTLNVNLYMKNALEQDLTVVLPGHNVTQTMKLDSTSTGIQYVYPLNTADEVFRELRTYLLMNEPGFYVPIENSFDWTVRYYQMKVPGSKIHSINVRTGLVEGGILFGHFGVCSRILPPYAKSA